MGSRAVVIVCRDEQTVAKRFGIAGQGIGICYTRTGRRFFNDASLESEFLATLSCAVANAELWEQLNSEWIILDCELMPWSAKAQELLKDQYAAVGVAAATSTSAAQEVLRKACQRGVDCVTLQERFGERHTLATKFIDAYRRYCWSANSLTDPIPPEQLDPVMSSACKNKEMSGQWVTTEMFTHHHG